MSDQQDDTLLASQPADPDLADDADGESDDPDGSKPAQYHIHHPGRYASRHLTEYPDTPGPTRCPLTFIPDPKKINGRLLTNPTRNRDRDMLNR